MLYVIVIMVSFCRCKPVTVDFVGVVPADLCVILYAGLLRHFISGAYYPKGGSSEIVYQIIPVIERHGGRVLVDAPVSKILLNESGKAHGNIILIFSPYCFH